MIIKSLIVSGKDKSPAALYFTHGANVIAGASDTGKSYVLSCLKFILGAKNPPKALDESVGYTLLTVEFEEKDGSCFCLQRELTLRAPIMLLEEGQRPKKLSAKHKEGNFRNLSNFLLGKFSLNDKQLLVGKENLNTAALSIRVLEKLFVVDEARIVAEQSPLGTGQNNGSTPEVALLRTVLTGVDDSEAKALKKDVQSSHSIYQKISAIEYLLARLHPEGESALEREADKLEEELQLEEELLNLREAELNAAISHHDNLLQEKRRVVGRISALDLKLAENRTLLERFESLKGKYQSDRERLIGIGEASSLLALYEDVACPTCGGQIHQESPGLVPAELVPAVQAEIAKIDWHMSELEIAMQDLIVSIKVADGELSLQNSELEFIESSLGSSISDLLNLTNESKEICSGLNSQILSLRHAIKSIQGLKAEMDELAKGLDEEQDEYMAVDFASELSALSTAIEQVLHRWGFPDYVPTTFDLKARDLVIGGKPRQSFGKGYRAIGFSAFVIGLMQHLSPSGRHPGFVVLDSPLTTYKQADQDRGEEISEEDLIAGDMIYSFYSDIAESYKDKQIIIFDNQEPDMSIIPHVNYMHFSRRRGVGRFGFFLPIEEKDYTRKTNKKATQ